MLRSLGLMSGTSMDGIDAALLETEGTPNGIKEKGNIFIPYSSTFKILLKATEYTVRNCLGDLEKANKDFLQGIQDYCLHVLHIQGEQFERLISEWKSELKHQELTLEAVTAHSTHYHAIAVKTLLKKLSLACEQIDVIGYHGQTLFHRPEQKISVIIGNGQQLADELGITVVNDFRRRDIAMGGLGAPFAPLYHQALGIRDNKIPLAVVNCGGIANITLIQGPNEEDVLGFDTGPGNCLIDTLIRKKTQGKENMDKDGQHGLKGTVNEQALNALYEKAIICDGKNYFSQIPPKSLDYGDIHLVPEVEALSLEDACATLEMFSAKTIVESLNGLKCDLPLHWICAGGGWHNPVIFESLKSLLHQKNQQITLSKADEVGWNSQALEAQIFAYLAVRSLKNKSISLPSVTRVSKALPGGQAYLPVSGIAQNVKSLIEDNPAILSGYF